MHILKVVIDGFKSYGERTELGPFDAHFNAITGFNGSGKSNILDAICFVLGTSSWSQMRANNSMELIHKQGTGSVIRAAVSITFDNKDKSRSPMQYVNEDFITVTRQVTPRITSYKINGKSSQVSEVHNLFHSVQLNMNNPHFLIMQGRISKVLNMKPKEILGMLEEASGTRMFESKKASVRKKIEGHENKVQNIDRTLNETINPTLSRLNKEKEVYIRYMNLKKEISELTHNLSVCQYALIKSQVASLTRKVQQADFEPQWSEEKLENLKNELEALQNEYNAFKATETDSKYELQELESKCKQISLDLKAKELEHQRGLKEIQKDEEAMESLATQNRELCALLEEKKSSLEEKKRNLIEAERKLLFLEPNSSYDGSCATNNIKLSSEYIEQISKLGVEISNIEQSISEVTSKISDAEHSSQMKEDARRYKELVAENNFVTENLKLATEKLESAWSKIDNTEVLNEEELLFKSGVLQDVQEESKKIFNLSLKSRIKLRLAALESVCKHYEKCLQSQDTDATMIFEEEVLRRTNFEYDDRGASVDPRRIIGRICRLVEVKEKDKCCALTVAGGSAWNYVLVESSADAMLMTRLAKTRTTFLMLQEVGNRAADEKIIVESKRILGDGNVWEASSLVEIDERYRPVLFKVLGNTLITRDGNMARSITFEYKIARSVSMAGDVYELRGTLTGGEEKEKREPLLLTLYRLKSRDSERTNYQKQLLFFNGQIENLNNFYNEWIILKNRADGLLQRLNLTSNPIQTMNTLKEQLQKLTAQQTEKTSLKAEYETYLKSLSSNQKGTSKSQHQVKLAAKSVKELQNAVVRLQAELNQLKNDLDGVTHAEETAMHQIKSSREVFVQLGLEMDYLKRKLQITEKSYLQVSGGQEDYQRNLLQLRRQVDEKSALVANWQRQMKAYNAQINEDRTRLEKLQAKLQDFKNYQNLDREALKYSTLEHELQSKISSDSQQLETVKEQIKQISFSLNSKAAQLADQFEREVEDLMKKKNIIKDDRDAIEATIKVFDQKKLSTLQKAFESVSKDFSDIFQLLSSGINAYLKMVGSRIEEGLEIQVELGLRSASLSELSGGQRSLLALSLILALLRYNPAPMYILDEIDSALDNSNTQNVGLVFKEKFPQSQFIIVSLKQDLLTFANVLFTASYNVKSGSSMITRTTPNRK